MPIDNANELFYWVDENDQEIGYISRAEAHDGSMKIHRSIVVVLENNSGQLLLQKRGLRKDKEPGLWSCAIGGHVTYGQSYNSAASRELQEELGLSVPVYQSHKTFLKKDNELEFSMVYTATVADTAPINKDPQEVEEVRWIARNKLSDFLSMNPATAWTVQVFQELQLVE